MASASQADSRGFDSRLSLQKRCPWKITKDTFFGMKKNRTTGANGDIKHDIFLPRLSVRARRALRPWRKLPPLFCHRRKRGYQVRNIFAAPVGSGSQEPCALRRKLPSPLFLPQAPIYLFTAPVGSGSQSLAPLGANSRLSFAAGANGDKATRYILPRLSVRARRALLPWRKLPPLFCHRRKRGYKIRYFYCACRFGLAEPCAHGANSRLSFATGANGDISFYCACRFGLAEPCSLRRKLPPLFCRRRKRGIKHDISLPRLSVRARKSLAPMAQTPVSLLPQAQAKKLALWTNFSSPFIFSIGLFSAFVV